MPDPFDAYQYLGHLRARWRLPAAAVAAAAAVSLAISLLLPKEYTATATLVIEPPVGTDPRASVAVSPIYLESLKTYEHFASSDYLFAQAVDRFQLRGGWGRRSIEGIKRRVLKVGIPRNTKILQISVTLKDPQKAHAVASYLAGEAVKLNRKANRIADDELVAEARNRVDEAARRLAGAEAARTRFLNVFPTQEALKAQLDELRSMREEVDRLSLSADLTVAERQGSPDAADKTRARSAGSRAARLRREAADLDRRIAAKAVLLAARRAQSDKIDAEYEAAWTAYDALEKRLQELQATAGYRGERLNLLDPGVVPERPSFPNVPLDVTAAAALALIASLFYLTAEFGWRSRDAQALRRTFRLTSKP
jgi:uncharacterized protein involved in exopolysaccharide biosynthesis